MTRQRFMRGDQADSDCTPADDANKPMLATQTGGGETVSAVIAEQTMNQHVFSFTMAAGDPGGAEDLGAGSLFTARFDVSFSDSQISWKVQFGALNSACAVQGSFQGMSEGDFSGTGTKTATATFDPAIADRYQVRVLATNSEGHNGAPGTLTIRTNNTITDLVIPDVPVQVLEQEHFRIREDTTGSNPGTPAWLDDEDPAVDLHLPPDKTFRIRYVIANTSGVAAGAKFHIYASKNSGSYAQITATSSNVQVADAGSGTSGDNLTTANFQLTAGTGSAVTGEYTEIEDIDANISGGQFTEQEWGLKIIAADVSDLDTLDIRVYYNNVALDVYDITPRIIVSKTSPRLESTTRTENNSDATSLVLNMPGIRPDNDLYIAFLGKSGTTAFTGIPGGWTEIYSDSAGTGDEAWGAAYWWEGSSEPATYSLTTDSQQSMGVIARISGHKVGSPIDVVTYTADQITINPIAPTATTVDDDTLVFRHSISDNDLMTATPVTEIEVGETSTAGGCGWGLSREVGPNPAGATGTATFTMEDNDDCIAATIAIAIVAAGGGLPVPVAMDHLAMLGH